MVTAAACVKSKSAASHSRSQESLAPSETTQLNVESSSAIRSPLTILDPVHTPPTTQTRKGTGTPPRPLSQGILLLQSQVCHKDDQTSSEDGQERRLIRQTLAPNQALTTAGTFTNQPFEDCSARLDCGPFESEVHQELESTTLRRPVLFVDVTIKPDQPAERLVLREGDTVAGAAETFAAIHGLTEELSSRLQTLLQIALQKQEQERMEHQLQQLEFERQV